MSTEDSRVLGCPPGGDRTPKPRLSWHAQVRAAELGFTSAEVEACVGFPEQSYPSHSSYGPGRHMYQRGILAVVVDIHNNVVITVLLRTQRRWTHGIDDRRSA